VKPGAGRRPVGAASGAGTVCPVHASSDRRPDPSPSLAARSPTNVRRAGPDAAFTLLEILLSILIITLLGAVLIGGSAQLLNERPVSVDEVFWAAVQEARKTALEHGQDVRLKFDGEKKRFLLLDGRAAAVLAPDGYTREETPLEEFPIATATADLEVDFLAQTKGGNAILVGGVLLESQPVPFVTFYGDGTCSPFRLQIFRSGAAEVLSIDPWTCAQVLTTKEAR